MKKIIAIVCGGDSSEHDVSMRSGDGLYSFFDKERYDVYIVEIKGMNWQVHLNDGSTTPINFKDFSFEEEGTQRGIARHVHTELTILLRAGIVLAKFSRHVLQ